MLNAFHSSSDVCFLYPHHPLLHEIPLLPSNGGNHGQNKKEEEEEKRKLNLRKMLKGEADLEFFSKYPELLKSVKRELISLHLLFVFFIAFALTQYICEKSTISLYFLPFYLALYPLLIVRTIKVFSLKAKGEKQEQSQE